MRLHVNHLIFNFLPFPILYPLLIVTSLFCPYPFQCFIRSVWLSVVVFLRFSGCVWSRWASLWIMECDLVLGSTLSSGRYGLITPPLFADPLYKWFNFISISLSLITNYVMFTKRWQVESTFTYEVNPWHGSVPNSIG